MKWIAFLWLLVAATAQAEIYRWRDARGTVHYTNREDEIPARYKGRAAVLNLGLPTTSAPSVPPVVGGATPPAGSNATTFAPVARPPAPPSPIAAPAPAPVASPRAAKRQRSYRDRTTHEDE